MGHWKHTGLLVTHAPPLAQSQSKAACNSLQSKNHQPLRAEEYVTDGHASPSVAKKGNHVTDVRLLSTYLDDRVSNLQKEGEAQEAAEGHDEGHTQNDAPQRCRRHGSEFQTCCLGDLSRLPVKCWFLEELPPTPTLPFPQAPVGGRSKVGFHLHLPAGREWEYQGQCERAPGHFQGTKKRSTHPTPLLLHGAY